jgi:hypothetical protein
MAVLVTIVILSLRSADKKQLTAFFAVLAALWAMPLYLLQLGGFVTGEQIQPRYMLPLMIVLLGTLLVRQDGKPLLTKPGELWFVIIALTLANAIALHTNIRRYTTGMGVQGFNLDSPREWWWLFFPDFLGPTLLWAIGSVSFGVLLWALLFRVVPGTFDSSGLAPRESSPELAPAGKA